jgi:hypothetical protein
MTTVVNVARSNHDILVHRITTDTKLESLTSRRWRLAHLSDYRDALPWLSQEAEVIDTTQISPGHVAQMIADSVGPGPSEPSASRSTMLHEFWHSTAVTRCLRGRSR